MNKIAAHFVGFFLLIVLVFSCTNKEIRLITNVNYTTTLSNIEDGFVNDLLPTSITVTPQVVLPEFNYYFKYELIEGIGSFQDNDGNSLAAGEDFLLNPETDFSLQLNYKASSPGNHIIRITTRDNFEKEQTNTISFTIRNIDLVWTATTTVTQVMPNETLPIVITLENNTPERPVTFQRNYQYTQGTGTITDADGNPEILGQFVTITPGVYMLNAASNQIGTNTITFNLEDSNGQEKSESITFEVVNDVSSTENDITAFTIPGQITASVIDPMAHTVAISVPFGTPLNVAPSTLTVSDAATVNPEANAVQDFSTVVTYTVTAENGDSQLWNVTVTVAPDTQSAENDITAFTIPGQITASVIDPMAHTVAISVPFGTSLNVAPSTLTVSDAATVNPEANAVQDFSSNVTYTVTAENGDPQLWTVTVTEEPDTRNTENDIIGFTIPGQVDVSVIDPITHTVLIDVPFGTPLNVAPSTFTLSDAATVNPTVNAVQDFSSNVTYTITAENGDPQLWTVTVTEGPDTRNTENDIIEFTIPGQITASVIDPITHTVLIDVPFGTPLNVAPSTLTVSDAAMVTPEASAVQDFSAMVTYTVTAENGDPQLWNVTVTVAPDTQSAENDITVFTIPGQVGSSIINTVDHTVTVTMPFGTDLSNLNPTIEVSDNATFNPVNPTDFEMPESIIVIAENGGTQTWTVTVNEEAPPAPSASFSNGTSVSVTFPNIMGTLTISNGPVAFQVGVFGGSGGSSITFTIQGVDSYSISAPASTSDSTTTPPIPPGTYTYSLSGSFSGSSGNSGSVNAL